VKEGQVAQGEQTFEKLQQVLEQRKAEMAKMETMEEKLSAEIATTRERTEKMQQELEEFAGAGALREGMEKRRERLAKDKQWMVHQRDVIAQEANIAESMVDEANKKCSDDETHAQLEVLEKQLRHQEQNLFQLRTYIESKTAECDYKPTATDVSQLTTDINDALCKAVTTF
jgi:intraflagellar transport protein 74